MNDKIILLIISAISTVSFIGFIINTIITISIKRVTDQHNTLWDAHNEKKYDSDNLKQLTKKVVEYESKLLEFTYKQDARNNSIDKKLEDIEKSIKHKDANQQNLVLSIFNKLDKIEDKFDHEEE